ncbi:MAG: DUF2585 family protein [Planctomycetota bacterium]
MSDDTPDGLPFEVSLRAAWTWSAVATLLTAVALLLMGRSLWCGCGSLVPWSFQIHSEHNSQHLFDPYAFTHVLHGVWFCAGTWLVLGRWLGPRARMLTAVSLEGVWELVENSSWVIERYRAETLALNYYGDSVLNSLADIGACALGFYLARRLPLWGSVLLFLGFELLLLVWIKDSLVLNVIMLVYPVEAIRTWQSGH